MKLFLVTCVLFLQFSPDCAVGVQGVDEDRGLGQTQGQQVGQLDLSDGDDVSLLSPELFLSSAS